MVRNTISFFYFVSILSYTQNFINSLFPLNIEISDGTHQCFCFFFYINAASHCFRVIFALVLIIRELWNAFHSANGESLHPYSMFCLHFVLKRFIWIISKRGVILIKSKWYALNCTAYVSIHILWNEKHISKSQSDEQISLFSRALSVSLSIIRILETKCFRLINFRFLIFF